MNDKNEMDLSDLPKGYWIENESDPFILGLRPEKKGCLIPAIFSLLLIYNTLTNSEISLAGAIGLVLFLTCIFLYCLLVANSTDTISISENDVIRFEGTGKIGITKKFKIDEVISIEIAKSSYRGHASSAKYYLKVHTETNNYPRLVILLDSLIPEKADFIKGILDKAVEDRKGKKQDPEEKQES